ncbi:unnamed protein product [Paramecium sonneborni]|uniref:2-methoxy-6-polyprenyl-1,4-benzoquinol methylase, mitochondrial n=1 Tax=Paramecium sonneborni TaxID=65129 RepID=A0A8S1LX09_9CILI|nr:unnamed protein product [Paramecium sonneborni]
MIKQLFKLRVFTFCQEANFGFKKVKLEEKQEHVNQVFHNVANNYDLMNDLMSVGLHRCWKNSFVEELGYLKNGDSQIRVLDVAGGTGDIAFRILEKHKGNNLFNGNLKITVLDINQSMLDVGQKRANELGYQNQIDFVCANAEELPFEANTFDAYTIAFGIRNVPRIPKAIGEAHRVLKQGGKFQCLEFSKVQNPVLSFFNQFYQFNFIPTMGQFVANDRNSYQYLVESIEKFHSQQDLLKIVEEAGFRYAGFKNYMDGVVAVHFGFKL